MLSGGIFPGQRRSYFVVADDTCAYRIPCHHLLATTYVDSSTFLESRAVATSHTSEPDKPPTTWLMGTDWKSAADCTNRHGVKRVLKDPGSMWGASGMGGSAGYGGSTSNLAIGQSLLKFGDSRFSDPRVSHEKVGEVFEASQFLQPRIRYLRIMQMKRGQVLEVC